MCRELIHLSEDNSPSKRRCADRKNIFRRRVSPVRAMPLKFLPGASDERCRALVSFQIKTTNFL
jgi:hypothetical protein